MALTQVPKELIKNINPSQISSGGATNGQVLSYSSSVSSWVAANPTGGSGGPGTTINNVDNTPIGSVNYFAISTPPVGYLECNGAVVSQTTYSDLYSVIGSMYNKGGEGAGNFRLPDLRGEFIRGWDNGKGVNGGRSFGSSELDAFQGHWHSVQSQSNGSTPDAGFANGNGNWIWIGDSRQPIRGPITDGANGTPRTASETRPRNVALLPCIKALKTVTGSIQSLNFIEKPAQASAGQVLTYNGTMWTAAASTGGSGGSARLPAGTAGQILRYDGTAWNAADNVDTIPIGGINYFAAAIAPIGYLECNGAVVSQAAYSDLYSVIGTMYNNGTEGSGNFRLPDLRGEFIRGWDNGRGVDSGRLMGSRQADEFKSHTHQATDRGDDGVGSGLGIGGVGYNASSGAGSINLANTGGTETRPRNVALMPCIKALKTTTATMQSLNFIEKPSQVTDGQALIYNSSTNKWVAGTVATGGATSGFDGLPVGSINYFAAETAPTGYLECNGAVISSFTYSELYQVIGTKYNKGGEGTGNFRLPDLRGEFVRGWDNGKGVDTGRALGSNQTDEFKSHTHGARGMDLLTGASNAFWWTSDNSGNSVRNTLATGGTETRPRNVALLPCIKALKTITGSTTALNFIEKPSQVTDGQALIYSSSTGKWVAGTVATGGATSGFDGLPIGSINYVAASTPPTGYLECNGAVVSLITYSELYSAIGTRFNTGGEGTGNFRLPDLRGEFVRGWDNGRGVDTGRTLGSNQGAYAGSNTFNITKDDGDAQGGGFTSIYSFNVNGTRLGDTGGGDNGPKTIDTTAGDTRPRNVALLPCIKALKTITGNAQSLNFVEKPAQVIDGQVLTYSSSANKWIAGTVIGMDSLPIGSINYFADSTPPTGYLECNGAVVSQITYSELYQVITTKYNTGGEGAGNFRLPDLRGEFIRGWDNGKGVDVSRVFGKNQDYATAIPKNTSPNRLSGDGSTENTLSNALYAAANPSAIGFARASKTGENTTSASIDAVDSGKHLDIVNVTIGDPETRPRNVALLPCIKAVKTVTGSPTLLNFIEKPLAPTNGQVITYNGTTNTWVASAVPFGPSSTSTVLNVSEPAIGLGVKGWGHYNASYYTKNQVYFFGNTYAVGSESEYYNPPVRGIFLNNYLLKNPSVTIQKVSDGLLYVVVLLSDGSLWASGNLIDIQNMYTLPNNYSGMFLKLNSMFANKVVTDFSFSSSADDIITLGVVCSDGTAYAWGYNGHGQFGRGNTTNSTTPVIIGISGKSVAQISVAGWSGTNGNILLRMTDGTLFASGYNPHGQLGVGDTGARTVFTQCRQSSSTFVTNVSSICETSKMQGGFTRYIIKGDGTLWGTGLNDYYQLGDGTTTSSSYYKQIQGINNVRKVVTCGWSTNTTVAALDSSGYVYTWGRADYGAAGQGTSAIVTVPTRVAVYRDTPATTAALPTIKDISGTDSSNVGTIGLVSTSKQLFVAGYQIFSPLSLMAASNRSTTTYYRFELAGLENVEEVAFYTDQLSEGGGASVGTIVRDSEGAIWSWGYPGGFVTQNNRLTFVPTRINY